MKVLKFYADGCAPCKTLTPILMKVAEEHGLEVEEINIEQNTELAQKYKIFGVPTVLFIRDGEEVTRFMGNAHEQRVRAYVTEALGS